MSPELRRPALPAWMSWSSGKDSTLALHSLRQDPEVEVVGLLTTVNSAADRVAMHAVRRTLLETQAERLSLPLLVVEIPSPCPNGVYEERMETAMGAATANGIGHVAFGDLFLEDVRAYREETLHKVGMTALFPIWGGATDKVARQIIDVGIKAVVTCIDPRCVPAELIGHAYDEEFLCLLPEGVDPCGEGGEFHTFVWDGPGFSSPIDVEVGEATERDGFVFCDVLPR